MYGYLSWDKIGQKMAKILQLGCPKMTTFEMFSSQAKRLHVVDIDPHVIFQQKMQALYHFRILAQQTFIGLP